jgi:hypothetical protein
MLGSDLVKRRAHVTGGHAPTPFDGLCADSDLSWREVARVSRVVARPARSLAGVCAGSGARGRAAHQRQRPRESPALSKEAVAEHMASVPPWAQLGAQDPRIFAKAT